VSSSVADRRFTLVLILGTALLLSSLGVVKRRLVFRRATLHLVFLSVHIRPARPVRVSILLISHHLGRIDQGCAARRYDARDERNGGQHRSDERQGATVARADLEQHTVN
jgi:hypothetical protein